MRIFFLNLFFYFYFFSQFVKLRLFLSKFIIHFFEEALNFFLEGKSSLELNVIYFDEIKSFLKVKNFKIYTLFEILLSNSQNIFRQTAHTF
jgi:hypothetical protein